MHVIGDKQYMISDQNSK